jgi:hypothetical protein
MPFLHNLKITGDVFLCFTPGQSKIGAVGCKVMNSRQRINKKLIIATLLWLLMLACGPLDRLQEFNRQKQKTLSTPTNISGDSLNITAAFTNLLTLPGYRLQLQRVNHQGEQRASQTITVEYDRSGNTHLTQDATETPGEIYVVNGQTYFFSNEYQGWVKTSQPVTTRLNEMKPTVELLALLTHPGVKSLERAPDSLLNRPATRYVLTTDPGTVPETRGTLWLDNTTGAVIKIELFLYEGAGSRPTQEWLLTVTAIGSATALTPPTPIIDPTSAAAVTATAEAQAAWPASITYQGQPVNFNLIPLQARQTANSSPRQVEVIMRLNQLPPVLFQGASFEPFLAQLRQKLTLSIPERNLVVTSSGFQLKNNNTQNYTLTAHYFFNADLEDFNQVELILSEQGNPLFMPIPVSKP